MGSQKGLCLFVAEPVTYRGEPRTEPTPRYYVRASDMSQACVAMFNNHPGVNVKSIRQASPTEARILSALGTGRMVEGY
jgi:hypothetical protein